MKKRIEDDNMEFNENISDINYSPKNQFSAVEYRPELENSDEFTEYQYNFFQNLIGLLIWILDIGRIDI